MESLGSPRRDASPLAMPVIGAKRSESIQWVKKWNTDKVNKDEVSLWQLRAEPMYIDVSPHCLVETSIGAWMKRQCIKKHHFPYIMVLLFALQAVLKLHRPPSKLVETTFDGEVFEMHQKSYVWLFLDTLVNITILFILLHFTNRDLIRKQIFAFDTIVIVGNYFTWFCTRAFSEYTIFHEHFDTDRVVQHTVETFVFLPLTVVIACFDSVKIARKAKVAIVGWMIFERMLQYYRHSGYADGDTFAKHGYCPAFGIPFECASVRGSHLSSNMTIIIFLLKSLRVYAMGGHFAVIKPKFNMVVRVDGSSCQLSAELKDGVGDTDDSDCSPRATEPHVVLAREPAEREAWLGGAPYDQFELRMCSSPPVPSETSTPKTGTGTRAGVLAMPAAQQGSFQVPKFTLAKPDKEASDSTSDSSGGGMFSDLRSALRHMELATGSLRDTCRGDTSLDGHPALAAAAPVHLHDHPHEDCCADSVRGVSPREEVQYPTPVAGGGWSPRIDAAVHIVSLTNARDETRRLCQAFERDLELFRLQLNALETEIADMLRTSDRLPDADRS